VPQLGTTRDERGLRELTTDDGASRHATPAEVQRQAAKWSEDFLECRLYGHHWRPASARFHDTYRYWRIVQRCPRCTSERVAELDSNGHVTSQAIHYADGYLTDGIGRIVGNSRDTLRLATIQRIFDVTKTRKTSELPHSGATRRALGIVDAA
jgi:hypothetical protein